MLTKKEIKVLELRNQGLNQVDIASKLKISQPAVSAFENNAKRKVLDAKSILRFITENKIKMEDE